MTEDEGNVTPALFAELWKQARRQAAPADESLAAFQRFMVLHEDMHAVWDRLVEDPATPLEVEGENLMLHITMDAATEQALQKNEPSGLVDVFGVLVHSTRARPST
jgi:hypothetical protein